MGDDRVHVAFSKFGGSPPVPGFHRTEGAPPEVQLSVYVDITTPPIWDGDTVTMVDLDLDLAQHIDGRILVLDEDEFANTRSATGIRPT